MASALGHIRFAERSMRTTGASCRGSTPSAVAAAPEANAHRTSLGPRPSASGTPLSRGQLLQGCTNLSRCAAAPAFRSRSHARPISGAHLRRTSAALVAAASSSEPAGADFSLLSALKLIPGTALTARLRALLCRASPQQHSLAGPGSPGTPSSPPPLPPSPRRSAGARRLRRAPRRRLPPLRAPPRRGLPPRRARTRTGPHHPASLPLPSLPLAPPD